MNNVDFYNLVVKGIEVVLKQGHACMNERNECSYTDGKGSCCVVGAMMPDEETRLLADKGHNNDTSVRGLFSNGFEWTKQFEDYQIRHLNLLQLIHDNNRHTYGEEFINDFKKETNVFLAKLKKDLQLC